MTTKRINAILIDSKDNVITSKEFLATGCQAWFENNGKVSSVTVTSDIPKFHKIALVDLGISMPVYKYGQLIGETIEPIKQGSHVHDHNITSPRKS